MTMVNGDGRAIANLAAAGPSLVLSEIGGGEECKANLRSAAGAGENATCLDGEREACSTSQLQRASTKQRGSTLQDLSNMEEQYDDDDDDDSDWEPVMRLISKKWFCTNCTMPNFDDTCYCDMCGEYKDSKILIHGCFASRLGEEDKTSSGSDITERCQDYAGCYPEGTAIGYDERMLLHSEVEMKSHPHPERPDRLRAITTSLSFSGLFPGKCFRLPSREITVEELQTVHSLEHIEAVERTRNMLLSYFTPDTYTNEHSACAARLAAGLCSELASAIMSGRARNGFALVRPPGHHAGIKQAMGFCLHNNAAVAAFAAQAAGAKKVLIVDWDVHHGNGTQEIFEANKSVLYISLHRHENGRFYPGTGAAKEVGITDAEGYCVNIPWKTGGVGDNDYIFAFQHVVLPIASEFAPDLTIISAGFDAARGDPLGCCDVTPDGYAQMTHMLNALSQGRLLVVLEGGYNLRSISSSAMAVIKVLLGDKPICEMNGVLPSRAGLRTILEVLSVQTKFWPILKSNYDKLQLQWDTMPPTKRKKETRKRRKLVGPIWWKWSSKRLMYIRLYDLPTEDSETTVTRMSGVSRRLLGGKRLPARQEMQATTPTSVMSTTKKSTVVPTIVLSPQSTFLPKEPKGKKKAQELPINFKTDPSTDVLLISKKGIVIREPALEKSVLLVDKSKQGDPKKNFSHEIIPSWQIFQDASWAPGEGSLPREIVLEIVPSDIKVELATISNEILIRQSMMHGVGADRYIQVEHDQFDYYLNRMLKIMARTTEEINNKSKEADDLSSTIAILKAQVEGLEKEKFVLVAQKEELTASMEAIKDKLKSVKASVAETKKVAFESKNVAEKAKMLVSKALVRAKQVEKKVVDFEESTKRSIE